MNPRDRSRVFKELWEKSDGRCMRCGKQLEESDAVIDHIFPRRYGGSDRVENLRLLCHKCNCILANRPFLNESEVQQYLQQFLSHDSRFGNVRTDVRVEAPDGQKIAFDIMFSRISDGQEQLYIVEVKSMSATTEQKIESAIQQLEYYRSIYPDAQFILAIPASLAEEYRQRVRAAGFILWDSETLRLGVPDIALPVCSASDQYDVLIDRLKRCKPGRTEWQIYQKLVGEILTVLFCPPLDPVSEQNADGDYANRRDFILPNYSAEGYWPYLRGRYQAEFIVVDAKNSASAIEKDDILQVAHYLKENGTGLFGIIFSRCGIKESAETHLRDIWEHERKIIIVLNDNDVEQMLLNKQKGLDPCEILKEKIQEFRLKI